jgi:DNA-binding FadR family transcriptional regulator
MNAVSFDTACEARFALERACAPLSAQRRSADHLAAMRAEVHRQGQPGLTDEAFCASDVAFHRALVDGAGNPVLSYQLAGAVEAMQPLMNMITFTARDRARIVEMHDAIAGALEGRDGAAVEAGLSVLERETRALAHKALEKRARERKRAKA